MEDPFMKSNISPELNKVVNDMFAASTQAKPEQELGIKVGCSNGFVVIEFNPVRGLYKIPKRDAKQLAKRLISEALK